MTAGWDSTPHLANAVAIGTSGATSSGVTLTSGAINTKGSWTPVIASTASDITHLLICANGLTAAGGTTAGPGAAIDIAVAPGGSEASGILIQNLVVHLNGGIFAEHFFLPVGQIPATSRIAARLASSTSADLLSIGMIGFDSGWSSGGNCGIWDTYGWPGTVSAVQGIALDPGATINTNSTYVVLSASTTNDYQGFFLAFDHQNRVTPTGGIGNCLIDIALGVSGSEVVIFPKYFLLRDSYGPFVHPLCSPYFPIPIAAGQRLTCRIQCDDATATDRIIGISFYGYRA